MFLGNGVLPEMDIVSFLKMKSYRKQILYVSWKWSLTGNGYCKFLENEVLLEMDIVCFLKMESNCCSCLQHIFIYRAFMNTKFLQILFTYQPQPQPQHHFHD